MARALLTREAVLAAVAEFDRLGRDGFLRTSGFRKAKSYFLDIDGVLYDAKAIVCWALDLKPDGLTDTDPSIATQLQTLGFSTSYFPVLPWKREEIVLACAVVAANQWRQPPTQTRDPQVIEVSALLQSSEFHPAELHGPDFRNPAGVARKMADIVTSREGYSGRPTRGNRLDSVVAKEFEDRPAELRTEAASIRARLLKWRGAPSTSPVWRSATPSIPTVGVDVRDVPVEANQTADFEVRPRSGRTVAKRREAQLVLRYQAWLAEAGHSSTGKLIFVNGNAALRIDLYDREAAEIVEAKGASGRDYIRFALGQVLDYARYVPHQSLAVLLPDRPVDDLVALLQRHGVSCVYETNVGDFNRISAEANVARISAQ